MTLTRLFAESKEVAMSETSALAATPQQMQAFQPQFTQIPNVGLSSFPSAVLFRKLLYLFHQQSGDKGWLWYTTSSNGQSWSRDQEVYNVGMSSAPSAVVFRDKLYVFHQGRGDSGALWYTTYDGSAWAPDRRIDGVGMSFSPGAAVFQDRLYVFHQGSKENGQLWYTSSGDGVNWSADQRIAGSGISDSPSAVVYRNALYVFHQGAGRNGQLLYNTFNGSSWSADQRVNNVALWGSPGAAVYFDGSIYVFHQQSNQSGNLLYTSYNGTSWISDQIISGGRMSFSPGAIDFNGNLQVYYQGPGKNGQLWQCLFDVAEIVRIDYQLDKATNRDQVLSVIATQTLTNPTSGPQTMAFEVDETVGQTSSFENSVTKGVSLEIGRSFEASIPVVDAKVGGSLTLGLSRSETWAYGVAESFSKSYKASFPVAAPPQTKIQCTATVSKCLLDVPYNMILRAKNGIQVPSEGMWSGITSWDLQSEFKEIPLSAAA